MQKVQKICKKTKNMTFLDKKEQSERLKLIRTKLQLTQTDMGLQLNYDRGYISSIESGRAPISFLLLESLSNLYKEKTQQHLNLNWLLLGFGDMSVESSQGQENNGIVNIANNVGMQTQNHLSANQTLQEKDILIAELRTEIKMLREFLSLKNA